MMIIKSFFVNLNVEINFTSIAVSLTDRFQASQSLMINIIQVFKACVTDVIHYTWNLLKERFVVKKSSVDSDIAPISKVALPILKSEDIDQMKEEKEDESTQKKMIPSPHSSLSTQPPAGFAISSYQDPLTLFKEFYQHQGTDIKQRTLSDLQNMNFDDKESMHDYIQWLFPIDEPSRFNSNAPVFSPTQFNTLRQNPFIKKNIKISFVKMLAFYGLEYDEASMSVKEKSDFKERADNWLTPSNHNFLRISRILRCLVLFEFNHEAKGFLGYLSTLHALHPAVITDKTFKFWEKRAEC